jgi:hypothetical protein
MAAARSWLAFDADTFSPDKASQTDGRALSQFHVKGKIDGFLPLEPDGSASARERNPALRRYLDEFAGFTDQGFCASSLGSDSGEKRRISYDQSRSLEAV